MLPSEQWGPGGRVKEGIRDFMSLPLLLIPAKTLQPVLRRSLSLLLLHHLQIMSRSLGTPELPGGAAQEKGVGVA